LRIEKKFSRYRNDSVTAWRSIEGKSTSHGLAIALNLTARRFSPRGSTINASLGASLACAATPSRC